MMQGTRLLTITRFSEWLDSARETRLKFAYAERLVRRQVFTLRLNEHPIFAHALEFARSDC
jgi:hypothetical protein